MASTPRVTVVIPTYQRAGTVGRAVRSVLAQEGCDFEVVVVDDGSVDGTAEILGAIDDPRLRVLHQANAGRGSARNAGVHAARAPLVTFLDSDDEALPGWLAELDRFADDPSVGAIRFGALRVGADGAVQRLAAGQLDAAHPIPRGACQPGTYAIATDVFRRLGGFDPDLEFSENTDLLARLALDMGRTGWVSRTVDVPTVLCHVELTTSRTARYGDAPRRAADVLLDRYADQLRSDGASRQGYLAIRGTDELRCGHRSVAARTFLASWCARPTSVVALARVASVALPFGLRDRIRGRE